MANIYVDAKKPVTSRGDGTPQNPFRLVGDALEQARAACGPYEIRVKDGDGEFTTAMVRGQGKDVKFVKTD